MYIQATKDIYGHVVHLTADKLRNILDLIDGYMKVPYEIIEIRQDNIEDPNERIDIEVRCVDEKDCLIHQKLLILKNELIDGKAFHERYHEWYK